MASARQRDGRWTGLYRDHEGHQRSAGTYGTKSAALKAARASEAIEAAGADARRVLREPEMLYSSEKKGKPTVAGYAPQWLSGHRLEPTSRATYQAQLKHIVSGLGNITLASLSAQQVRAFIRHMEAGRLSSSTTGLIVTTLREMCKTAVDDGLMARDVTSGIKIAGRHARELRILSPLEYRAVLAATPVHYKLLVEMAAASGMRWGELMGLQADDVISNGSGYTVRVRRVMIEVAGKTSLRGYGKTPGATRPVTVDRDLGERLIAAGRRDPDGFVFRAEKGGVLHRSNFARTWKKACTVAGVEGVRPHDLRHTSASWLLDNGAKLVEVRDRLGHSSIAVTSRYLHPVPGQSDSCLAALDRAKAA
jgi:integrase